MLQRRRALRVSPLDEEAVGEHGLLEGLAPKRAPEGDEALGVAVREQALPGDDVDELHRGVDPGVLSEGPAGPYAPKSSLGLSPGSPTCQDPVGAWPCNTQDMVGIRLPPADQAQAREADPLAHLHQEGGRAVREGQ